MTVIHTQQGTPVRSQSQRRFVLLAETITAHRDWDAPGKPVVVDAKRNAHIVKRSDNRATLEAHVDRNAHGFQGTEFTQFTIADQREAF